MNALNNLLPLGEPLAILCGAGVSLSSPSNLLDGRSFMTQVLRRVRPAGVLLARLFQTLGRPGSVRSRPGHFLRFELLMKALQDSELDRNLSVLDCLECDKPNKNHFLLASLVHTGCVVMTTNFDTLVEQAYQQLNPGNWPELRVAIYNSEFPANGPDAVPTLWKLHGSLSRGGTQTRDSIAATLATVLAGTETGPRLHFLEQVLRGWNLLVVGYSGWDDFDIVSTIAATESAKQLVWVDHLLGFSRDVQEMHEREGLQNTFACFEGDVVGRDRVFFNANVLEQKVRTTEKLLMVRDQTTRVLEEVCGLRACADEFPAVKDDNHFGRAYPREVIKFFRRWAHRIRLKELHRWIFLQSALENRLRTVDRDLGSLVDKMIREYRLQSKHDPKVHLQILIERFNDGRYNRPLTIKQTIKLKRLHCQTDTLRKQLSVEDDVTALRLKAWIVTKLEGVGSAHALFKESALLARSNHLLTAELMTLLNWRRNYYASLGEFDANTLEYPSDNIEDRIRVLADNVGFLPAIYEEDLDFWLYPYLVEEYLDLDWFVTRVSKIRRFYVDAGDVHGEAKASLLLAHAFSRAGMSSQVAAELLRRRELESLLGYTVDDWEDLAPLGDWRSWSTDPVGLETRMRSSMWEH